MKLNWIFKVSARKVTADSIYKFVSAVQRCNQKGGELSEGLAAVGVSWSLRGVRAEVDMEVWEEKGLRWVNGYGGGKNGV